MDFRAKRTKHLKARVYYIEAIHIADDGSDHVSVAWKRASDTSYSLIPANLLYRDAMMQHSPARLYYNKVDVRLELGIPRRIRLWVKLSLLTRKVMR